MFRTIILSASLFSAIEGFSQSSPLPANYTADRREAISSLLKKYTDEGIPGIVLSVKTPGATFELSAGFSSVEDKMEMTPHHQLMVASITKMFMGVVALQLAESGMIHLDKPIIEYPGGADLSKIPNADVITVRHLMNHTSGLPDFVKHPAFFLNVLDKPGFDWQQKDLLRFLEKQKPEFSPGARAMYCNSNYLLLAKLIDGVLGGNGKHVNAVNENILRPLHLENSIYTQKRTIPPGAANGYAELYNNGRIINVSRFNTGGSGNGYSGLYSNASDLHCFLRALFEKKLLLSDSSLRKMLSFVPDSEEKDVFFGLGLWREFSRYGDVNTGFGHRGRDLAHTTELWWFPGRQMSVVILVNSGALLDSELTRRYKSFRKEVFELLLGVN